MRVPVRPLSPRPRASALKSCLKSLTHTKKKKALFRTTCVKFSTATTAHGGRRRVGMAFYHMDVRVENIALVKPRGGPIQPMNRLTCSNLLSEIGCSADDIDNEAARIERLHAQRASRRDFAPDSDSR
ncbi:hypothetical protein ACHHYP_13751 [Achlya hypogyna]|uniref:Uncharacterized protein n=1 Tax=Achlya hypogyna TaxID=1202772 RepID=A0A1V9YEQ9_ACHHY|nr:hypothetical protein ACHHYP_13751 [Achlya hypogyna]